MRLLPILLVCSITIASVLPAQNSGAWTLTFADEFDGADLDLSRWSPHDPLRKPGEQAYTPEAVRLNGGQLHIISRGVISTFGTFAQTYGRFEIRCKITETRGLRPEFKLLPVPLGPLPEIGVLEVAGAAPADFSFFNRWGSEQTQRSYGDSIDGPDLSTGFHTIAVEWDTGKIVWSIDGKEKFRSSEGVPHQAMYLLLSLTMDRASTEPASFDIDYIRVYQRR
jgi:beta-glucanase (GH16 family)